MKIIGLYVWNIVQAFDRLVNAILGGTDKEYISSRVYRYKDVNALAMATYRLLNWLEPNHCENAYIDAQIGFDPNDAVIK
jgi:hypothetical protein